MNEPNYLTDEELLALIETTQRGELLHAPKDLKVSILTQAEKAAGSKQPNRKKQFYSYCFRVGLATAACLAILFLPTPAKESSGEVSAPTISLSQHLNQFTDRLEQGFSDFNSAFADFDFNFDFNFGGNRNE